MSHYFSFVRSHRSVVGLAIACVVFVGGCNGSGGGGGDSAPPVTPGRFGAQFGPAGSGSCQLRGILAVQTELANRGQVRGSFVPVDQFGSDFGVNSGFSQRQGRFTPLGGFAPPGGGFVQTVRCGTDACVLDRIFTVGLRVLELSEAPERSFRLREAFQRCGQDAICQLRVVARMTSLQAIEVTGGGTPQCGGDVGCLLEVARSNSIRALSAFSPNARQVYHAAAASCR